MTNDDQSELIDPGLNSIMPRLMTVLQHALRRDTYVGLDTIAVVCETIAVDARFNMWISGAAKRSATLEQFERLADEYDSLSNCCVNTVTKFHEDHQKAILQRVLRDIAARLTEMTKTQFGGSNHTPHQGE